MARPSDPQPHTSISSFPNPSYPKWVHVNFLNTSNDLWRKTFFTETQSSSTAVSFNAGYNANESDDEHGRFQASALDPTIPPKYYPLSMNAPLDSTLRNHEENCYSITLDSFVSQELPYQKKITRSATYSRIAASAAPVPTGGTTNGLGWIYYQKEGEESLREIEVSGFRPPTGEGNEISGTGLAFEGTHLAALADSVESRLVIFQGDGGIYEVYWKSTWSAPKKVIEKTNGGPLLRMAVTQIGETVCLYYCHKTKVWRMRRNKSSGLWDQPVEITLQDSIAKTCLSVVPSAEKKDTALLFYQGNESKKYHIQYLEDKVA